MGIKVRNSLGKIDVTGLDFHNGDEVIISDVGNLDYFYVHRNKLIGIPARIYKIDYAYVGDWVGAYLQITYDTVYRYDIDFILDNVYSDKIPFSMVRVMHPDDYLNMGVSKENLNSLSRG